VTHRPRDYYKPVWQHPIADERTDDLAAARLSSSIALWQ
jgi:hypothetical protein